jgi:hypothetical protein
MSIRLERRTASEAQPKAERPSRLPSRWVVILLIASLVAYVVRVGHGSITDALTCAIAITVALGTFME